MTAFAILLVALALLLFWVAGRQRRQLGLPEGRLLYEDMGAGQVVAQPLYAADLGLSGRPDYLVQGAQGLVPVEVKSGRSPSRPYDSHVFQLAAYCALVERTFGQRPSYGILRYPRRSFQVEYSQDLESRLLALLQEMRAKLGWGEVDRSHQAAARCHACGYLDLCEQHL